VRYLTTQPFEDSDLAAWAVGVLGGPEREALRRRRSPEARRDFLAAHALARTMIAEMTGGDPARIRLRQAAAGRPELASPPGAHTLDLSISHSDGVALCAVARGCKVGVDVESLRNVGPDPIQVARTVCTGEELDALGRLNAMARVERFLFLWT